MRTKITIVLSFLALGVGALSLYEGWGRVSLNLVYTAFGLALIKSTCFKSRSVALTRHRSVLSSGAKKP
jgi:hypothetical protein